MPEFPPVYIDPDTREEHDWDDTLPAEDDGEPYTYREMAYDQADANGMDIDEWLERLAFRRGEGVGEKLSPSWVDDEDDGIGE